MINENTVKRYCSEDPSEIENYAQAVADTTQTWHCHHRRGLKENLHKDGEYYNRPASELIFLPPAKHLSIHSIGNTCAKGKKSWLGKHHSMETRMLLSKKAKDRKPISDETRKRMSISHKGNKGRLGQPISEEVKSKISKSVSKAKTGYRWWNNGITTKQAFESPGEGWTLGRIKKTED